MKWAEHKHTHLRIVYVCLSDRPYTSVSGQAVISKQADQ
jgi:hypothetical protein